MRLAALLCLMLLAACEEMPDDPNDTLEKARGGVLRVGISDAPPWAIWEDGQAAGVEARLIEAYARSIGAEVEWVPGGTNELLRALEKFELAVVVAGLTQDSPWKTRVALTRPYAVPKAGEKHVMAVPPGENAMLVSLERFLIAASEAGPVSGAPAETVYTKVWWRSMQTLTTSSGGRFHQLPAEKISTSQKPS